MSLKIAERGRVPPFIVMDVMRAAAEREAAGADVLHLEVGQPATGAPSAVARKLAAIAAEAPLGYTVAQGLPALRDRIARYYRDSHGVTVPRERIVATTGSSGGFLLSFLAAFAPGDRVGLAAPGYPAYRNILSALGCTPVTIQVGADTRFQPTRAVLDSLDVPLDGLIVASPSNPTGSMLPPDDLAELARWCHDAGVRLISDEIYHGITFGMEAATACAFSPSAVVINSFSKYYCMTGWRLGWMVLPDDMIRPVECLAQNLFISPPALSQHAGALVFDETEELSRNVARYAENRRVLLEGLPAAGFDRLAPADGAFYLYADVSDLTDNSEAFCKAMLAETGVAATPGTDFDPDRGHGYVRFSFAGSTETMVTACARLKAWLGSR